MEPLLYPRSFERHGGYLCFKHQPLPAWSLLVEEAHEKTTRCEQGQIWGCRLHPKPAAEWPRADPRPCTSQSLPPGWKTGKVRPKRLEEAGHRASRLGPLPWPGNATHMQDVMAEGEFMKEAGRSDLGLWGEGRGGGKHPSIPLRPSVGPGWRLFPIFRPPSFLPFS